VIVPLIALIVLLLVYAVLGLRTIEEHEQGLLTRFGRHLRVLEPGLHLIIPLVDRLQRIDLREVSVIKRIEPEAVGRIRIGSEEWEARTHDRKGIGPGTPIRISPVEGQVMVVTAGT
jgi:regulator of protease activity HflC (stomatin/prohibitin superfamily)